MEYAYYHYADAANRPTGPLTAEQLHALVQVDHLSPETNVWKEGTTHWQPYRYLFPPPVHMGATTLLTLLDPPPTQSVRPWYKCTGWSLVLFCFFSPVMLPLMWYWRLYTRKVRIWVTVGFAGLLLLVVVVGTTEQAAIQREFDEKKEQLLTQVKAAADARDYALVVRLGERYEFVHDTQLDTYLHTARAGRKAAAEQERPEKAADAPVTSWSHLTKAQWKDKAARTFGWFSGVPLQAPAARFQEVMGKPDHTQTVGDDVFWYYECLDGTVQMEMDPYVLQMNTVQAQINDF